MVHAVGHNQWFQCNRQGGSRFNLLDSSSQPHSSTDVDSVSTQLPHDSDGSLFKGMSYQPVSRASVF